MFGRKGLRARLEPAVGNAGSLSTEIIQEVEFVDDFDVLDMEVLEAE